MTKKPWYGKGGVNTNGVYSGVASFGLVTSGFKAFIATFLGVVGIIVGIYLMTKKDKDTAKTEGTVTNVITKSINNRIVCDYSIAYNVDNIGYTTQVTGSYYCPTKGDSVTVYYNPSDPSEAEGERVNYLMIGGIVLGFSILILTSAWIIFYLSRRYKWFAAFEGVSFGLNAMFGGRQQMY